MLLKTFGRAELLSGDGGSGAELLLPFGKPLAVLIYLSAAPRRSATRDELVDLLWSTSDPDRGRASLRQALSQVRQVVGTDVFSAERETVSLVEPCVFDRNEFLSAIAAAEDLDAIGWYDGAFLPDIAVPGGRAFEDWAELQQVSLRAAYQRALESSIRASLDRADFRQARELAFRLRDDQPERERWWRVLLETLLAAQDLRTAQSEVEALEHQLARDAEIPEPATSAIIAKIRSAAASVEPLGPGELRPDLVGRDSEFAQLVSEWRMAVAGTSRHVAIVAPAGFGKTRLLEDFRARLRSQRARVVVVRAQPGERHLDRALAAELARQLSQLRGASSISPSAARVLAQAFPLLESAFGDIAGRTKAPSHELELVTAVAELFDATASDQPTAVLIDDMHWADAVSRRILQAAMARLTSAPLLIVTTSREADLLPASAAGARLVINALRPDDANALVAGIADLPDGTWVTSWLSALYSASGGSPYLTLEIVAGLLRRELLHIRAGRFHTDSADSLIKATRNALLDGATSWDMTRIESEVLLLLSVAGVPLRSKELAACLSLEAATIDQSLMQLATQRLASPAGDDWTVAHDVVRDTMLARTEAQLTRAAHLKLADALRHEHTWDAQLARRIARHLCVGGDMAGVRNVFHRYVREARARDWESTPEQLVHGLIGEYADAATTRDLVASLPLSARYPFLRYARTSVLLSVAVVAVVAFFAVSYPTDMKSAEVDWSLGPDRVAGGLLVFPSPVVDEVNVFGGRIASGSDTIVARSNDARFPLTGDTIAVASRGRAEFRRLGVGGAGEALQTLSFVARGGRLHTTIKLAGDRKKPRLTFNWAIVNGRRLTAAGDTIRVHPGEKISGVIETTYHGLFGAATLVMGTSPTWGDAATAGKLAGYLLSNAGTRVRQDSISEVAPSTPGTYFILFAYSMEADERYVLSATNWTMGEPRWHDGNDLASLGLERLTTAAKQGYDSLMIPALTDGKETTRPGWYGMTGITVLVR
ncbi:MAG: AAA family ATPase [Gemmatimonadaceae bacterium]